MHQPPGFDQVAMLRAHQVPTTLRHVDAADSHGPLLAALDLMAAQESDERFAGDQFSSTRIENALSLQAHRVRRDDQGGWVHFHANHPQNFMPWRFSESRRSNRALPKCALLCRT